MAQKKAILTVVLAALVAIGCGGEAPDRPEDCTEHEFFNERTRRCTPCPAIDPPDCPEGCGYEVIELENGCPGAKCAPNCELCGVGQYYAEQDGLCRTCPGRPDCASFACKGALGVEGSFEAPCPPVSAYTCGDCTEPENGCTSGDDGQCVDISK